MTRNTPHDDAFRPEHNIAFFASTPHDCSYLPGQSAVTVFADPDAAMTMDVYNRLAEQGFRRSGKHVYIPRCQQCQACIPARIPVADFQPNRNQRRTQRYFQNQGIELTVANTTPVFRREHFLLYRRYLNARHAGAGMDNPAPNNYIDFLISPWTTTEFVEFRDQQRLLAVAVVDVLSHGLSCVYTFFEPDFDQISLGRYVLLWQIEETRHRGLDWLFLGFWIKDCKKMFYKQEYRPIELLQNGRWQRYDRTQSLT